jgi:hypothetical protein
MFPSEKTALVQFKKPQFREKPAIGKRLRGFMKRMWDWRRENRHKPLREQYDALCAKLRGYYQYFGIRGNYKLLEVAFEHTERAWKFWLSRRSHKSYITWRKFIDSIRSIMPLPKPRITHNL